MNRRFFMRMLSVLPFAGLFGFVGTYPPGCPSRKQATVSAPCSFGLATIKQEGTQRICSDPGCWCKERDGHRIHYTTLISERFKFVNAMRDLGVAELSLVSQRYGVALEIGGVIVPLEDYISGEFGISNVKCMYVGYGLRRHNRHD